MESRIADCGLRIEQRVLIAAIVVASTFLSACNRRPVKPAVPSAPPAALAAYESAEKSFDAGDYAGAIRSYDSYLSAGIAQNLDRALFRDGLAHALLPDDGNGSQSRALFRRLVTQYPGSPYSAPANLILKLQTDVETLQGNLKDQQARVKTLTEELKRLKDIDMRRVPSRPPH